MQAQTLPKFDRSRKSFRKKAIDEATANAMEVPFQVMKTRPGFHGGH